MANYTHPDELTDFNFKKNPVENEDIKVNIDHLVNAYASNKETILVAHGNTSSTMFGASNNNNVSLNMSELES